MHHVNQGWAPTPLYSTFWPVSMSVAVSNVEREKDTFDEGARGRLRDPKSLEG